MPYLIDTNVFIQAKNFFYRFDFCEDFWNWMEAAHAEGLIFSIQKVKKELQASDRGCPARAWAENLPGGFFLADVGNDDVMANYARVVEWAVNSSHYRPHAIAEFAKADVADAFLIASALTHGFEIVSQEESKPEAKKKIYLPDAARAMGVRSIPYYELLTRHARPNFRIRSAA
ncbi:MAG: DUF4411 family protein [Aromatoleum sp.]|jgi:hypothetical protein|uniref:DUF4411 family protein n=1 Tax=Aromatoleum sp. TaxID=2307007 RepID=UPI0028940289|nr:DUF4411 family protein [Aromatoleum sp.]MDT3668960.1 DUF4411 family protein [Aromatoleum sp.]